MSSHDAPLPEALYSCANPSCKGSTFPTHHLQWWAGSDGFPAGWYCNRTPEDAGIACFGFRIPTHLYEREGPLLSEEIARRCQVQE